MNQRPKDGYRRRAKVRGFQIRATTIAHYLPANYSVVGSEAEDELGEYVLIEGVDNAGWSLDGYVTPRLLSGLYVVEEEL